MSKHKTDEIEYTHDEAVTPAEVVATEAVEGVVDAPADEDVADETAEDVTEETPEKDVADETPEAPAEGEELPYFFPNIQEGTPFAGMFTSKEEANDANNHYLHEGDK